MLCDSDTLLLAPSVVVHDGLVIDGVRGAAWPLNATGAFVLDRAGAPLEQIVRELAAASPVPVETVRDDLLRFAWHLNALALVNIGRGRSPARRLADWFVLAVQLAPAGAWPAPVARRHALDTRSVHRAVAGSLEAIAGRVLALAVLATIAAVQLSVLAGADGFVVPVLLGLGTGAGVALHEAAHVALLRGVPSALILRGRRTYVLHARVSPSRRAVVALAGPLGAAALGVAVVLGGAALTVPSLTVAGCPLAAHAFALTIVGGDGRIACGL